MQEKVQKALSRIEAALAKKGERFTSPRYNVMATLLTLGKPAKAYDIVDMVGDGVKPMTVYRALDFLAAQGLVHRIESMNAYAPCAESHCAHRDSQYLICEKCEDIQELHNHKIDDTIAAELKKSKFAIAKKTIEIRGLCRKCA